MKSNNWLEENSSLKVISNLFDYKHFILPLYYGVGYAYKNII